MTRILDGKTIHGPTQIILDQATDDEFMVHEEFIVAGLCARPTNRLVCAHLLRLVSYGPTAGVTPLPSPSRSTYKVADVRAECLRPLHCAPTLSQTACGNVAFLRAEARLVRLKEKAKRVLGTGSQVGDEEASLLTRLQNQFIKYHGLRLRLHTQPTYLSLWPGQWVNRGDPCRRPGPAHRFAHRLLSFTSLVSRFPADSIRISPRFPTL